MPTHSRTRAPGSEMPHVVFFPFPAQGHVSPALQLAKLLHRRHGLQVTFIHTEHNRRRLLRARGPDALDGVPGFRFAAVPDGLPPSDEDAAQDMPALLLSMEALVPHFKNLVSSDSDLTPAACVITDMDCILRAAKEMDLITVGLWTTSACSLMALLHCQQLIDRGIVPLKDAEQLRNGYLEKTVVDWVPGMPKDMRLKDFPSFIRTTDPNDAMLARFIRSMAIFRTNPSAIIIHTFDELEHEVLAAMATTILPPVYAVGPIPLLVKQVAGGPVDTLGSNLWTEKHACLEWLGGRRASSVVYVSFGSLLTLTNEQLVEFAWGLANSGYEFLWVMRNDQAAVLPREFVEKTKERGHVTSWCPQDAVLQHEAVGAFLTHCGWNSMMESICAGVPMLCWPFVADQPTNCRHTCSEWRVGVEIGGEDVKRDEVKAAIVGVMEGGKGKEMKRMAMEWKEKAAAAALTGGPSWVNLEKLVKEVLNCY